jgi:hypothetical protein
MKTMKIVLLSFVLLATACSQNTTTPTLPPTTNNPCGIYTNSNEFIELKINGNTFRTVSYAFGGNKFPAALSNFYTDTFFFKERRYNISCDAFGCANTSYINTLSSKFWNKRSTNSTNYLDYLGIYKGYGEFDCYSPNNTVNFYKVEQDSITLTITSCTADFVSGTFVGNALEIPTNILYPFSGSFKNLKRNGF